jgi:photosystem II stability/assembly factor-like uncharacterized protein
MDQINNSAAGTAAAITTNGRVFWSADYGQSWTERKKVTGLGQSPIAIYCNGSSKEAWVSPGDAGMSLFHTIDGGSSWQAVKCPSSTTGNCFAPLDAGQTTYPVAMAGNDGTVYWIK